MKKEPAKIQDLVIFVLMILTVVGIGIYAFINSSVWVLDNFLLLILIAIIILLHKKLHIKTYMLVFAYIAIFLHSAGTFGWYSTEPLGLRYDYYTHFIGGFVLALIIYNYLDKCHSNRNYRYMNKITVIFLTIMAVAGLGTLIEITEFAGYKLFGTGEGIFLWGVGDGAEILFGTDIPREWINTMWDLINNLIGAITGVLVIFSARKAILKEK